MGGCPDAIRTGWCIHGIKVAKSVPAARLIPSTTPIGPTKREKHGSAIEFHSNAQTLPYPVAAQIRWGQSDQYK